MDMSPAALPPRQPTITDAHRAHPLFPTYQHYRNWCAATLIEASGFHDWLYQREQAEARDHAAHHPQFPAFQAWMRDSQGGARPCPAGSFPDNFQFWLDGGRW